jgi:hypothetical protein
VLTVGLLMRRGLPQTVAILRDQFLGHASITSTAIYTAISPKRLAGVRVTVSEEPRNRWVEAFHLRQRWRMSYSSCLWELCWEGFLALSVAFPG